MVQSGPRQEERLRIFFSLIACALFFAAASPPATAQFKAWVMAKLPDTPEGLGVDSDGNLYATLMHIGEVVMLKDDGIYDHIAWVPSKEESGKGAFPAILHCFTGGRDLAFTAIELGHYVSFTGILTFKNSQALRDIAAALPPDRILVETDAPYLAPLPFRGKRNEPAFVVETAKVLAATRGVTQEEIARQTTENFFRLFSKVPKPANLPATA